MAEFSVKEIARNIDTSTQYVYQQIQYLMDNGLAYRDEKNKPIIYDKGLEFLRNKRMAGLQVANKGLQSDFVNNDENAPKSTKKDFASVENIQEIIAIYKNLYEEQKQEANYWKDMFIEKDRALTEIASSFLLSAGKEEQPKKKKWFFM